MAGLSYRWIGFVNIGGPFIRNHNSAVPNKQSPGSFLTALLGSLRRKNARNFLLLSKRNRAILPVGNLKVGRSMKEKPDVLQQAEIRELEQTVAIIARFFEVKAEDLS